MDSRPQVISSQPRFEGRIFSVRTDRVRFDDGATVDLDVVAHRGSYAVIALPSPSELVLVRQYRHPAGRAMWELPAGAAEPGESIIEGALRELAEETGYRASRARVIGTFFTTPGFCAEQLHLVVAEGLIGGEQQLDEDERLIVQNFTIEEAGLLLGRGEICDAKTVIALLWMRGSRAELAPGSADN